MKMFRYFGLLTLLMNLFNNISRNNMEKSFVALADRPNPLYRYRKDYRMFRVK